MNSFGHLISNIGKPVGGVILLTNKRTMNHVTRALFRSTQWVGRASSHYSYFYQPSRNAGHSKWANIKHTKGEKDQERSAQITRFVNMIKIAIREGGGKTDPKVNSRVANVMSQIKEAKLSMAPFEKALEREATRSNEKRQTLVFKGPGNCVLLAEICTDHLLKAKQELNTVLRKNKGIVAEDNSLHLFDHKGIILATEFDGKPASPDNLDNVIIDAIEAGADDVAFQSDHPDFGNVYEFCTSPDSFFRVKHTLEKCKYTIAYGDVEYVPIKPIELDDVVIQDALKLYQKLIENPNVVKVTTNIA